MRQYSLWNTDYWLSIFNFWLSIFDYEISTCYLEFILIFCCSYWIIIVLKVFAICTSVWHEILLIILVFKEGVVVNIMRMLSCDWTWALSTRCVEVGRDDQPEGPEPRDYSHCACWAHGSRIVSRPCMEMLGGTGNWGALWSSYYKIDQKVATNVLSSLHSKLMEAIAARPGLTDIQRKALDSAVCAFASKGFWEFKTALRGISTRDKYKLETSSET